MTDTQQRGFAAFDKDGDCLAAGLNEADVRSFADKCGGEYVVQSNVLLESVHSVIHGGFIGYKPVKEDE